MDFDRLCLTVLFKMPLQQALSVTLLVRAWSHDLHLYAGVIKSSPVESGVESRPVGPSFKCARLVSQSCFACLCV